MPFNGLTLFLFKPKALYSTLSTFTPRGARAIASQLNHMQNLEVINFGDCMVKTAGAKFIAKALTDDHQKLKVGTGQHCISYWFIMLLSFTLDCI